MQPIDYRNATFDQVVQHLNQNRLHVLAGLRQHGPCTTRALAHAMHMDVLSVRPRVTELCQLGYAECLDTEGHEGTYIARTDEAAQQHFADRQAAARNPQLDLFVPPARNASRSDAGGPAVNKQPTH